MSETYQRPGVPATRTQIERAKARIENAEARIERAETRTEQAKTRTESAETRTERAETRTESAKTRTEQAEIRTEKAETRAEHAESALEGLLQKHVCETPLKHSPITVADNQRALERLTARQREILGFIAHGKNTKQIAALLKLSPKTVEYHRLKLMAALKLHDIPKLVRFAMKVGLVAPHD